MVLPILHRHRREAGDIVTAVNDTAGGSRLTRTPIGKPPLAGQRGAPTSAGMLPNLNLGKVLTPSVQWHCIWAAPFSNTCRNIAITLPSEQGTWKLRTLEGPGRGPKPARTVSCVFPSSLLYTVCMNGAAAERLTD